MSSALRIRLQRRGHRNKIIWRIGVIQTRRGPKASFKEILGSYDPNTATGSTILRLDTERVKYWVTRGAVPSYAMRRLMITAGMLPPQPKFSGKSNLEAAYEAQGIPFDPAAVKEELKRRVEIKIDSGEAGKIENQPWYGTGRKPELLTSWGPFFK